MAVRTGSRGSDNLVGTNSADVISGYDPSPTSPATIAAKVIASGLSDPLYLTSAPDSASHLFIVEKGGRVKVSDGPGQIRNAPFLDVSSQIATAGEQGLL